MLEVITKNTAVEINQLFFKIDQTLINFKQMKSLKLVILKRFQLFLYTFISIIDVIPFSASNWLKIIA